MSIVAKEITNLLTAAVSKHDHTALQEAHKKLKQRCEEYVISGTSSSSQLALVSPDLYVFTAEAALNFPDQWDIVAHCVDRILEEDAAMTNAYRIRGLFVRAALERRNAEGLRGPDLISAVQRALTLVVNGIKIALMEPATLSHLSFMGTQYLWNLGSILYQDGTYAEYVPVLAFAVAVLDKIECADLRLKATWLFRLATAFALSATPRPQEAWAAATKAAELVTKSVPALRFWSFRMLVGLCKAAPNPKIKADARGVFRGIYAAHSVLCGLVDETSGEAEVIGAINEITVEMSKATGETDDRTPSAKTAAGTAKAGSKKGALEIPTGADEAAVREEVYAELGLAAAYVGQLKVAADIANKAAVSKRLSARIYSDYTKAVIQASQCEGLVELQNQIDFTFCSPEVAHELLNAVRRLERAIESALRVPEPLERNFIVQQGALLLWNIALPLLQPTTRAQLSKSLVAAAHALDAIGSNLSLLRAQLHLEIACADADAQFVAKALTRLDAALRIDYLPPTDHAKLYGLAHPLDRYLLWMKRTLLVKGQLYSKPDGAEDEALLALEQAADVAPGNRAAILQRAAHILSASEPPLDFYVEQIADASGLGAPPPGGAGKAAAKGATTSGSAKAGSKATAVTSDDNRPKLSAADVEHRRQLMRVRTQLWSKLLQLAWEGKSFSNIEVGRQAGSAIVQRSWPRKGDRDMRIMQASAHLSLADMAVVELGKAQAYLGQMDFFSELPTTAAAAPAAGGITVKVESEEAVLKAAAAKANAVAAAQSVVQSHLAKAASIGNELVSMGWPDQWIVCNAAIALWNYFCKAFSKNNFTCAATGLDEIVPLLLAVNIAPQHEPTLLADLTYAHAYSLVQQYLKERLNLSDAPRDLLILAEHNPSTATLIDPNHAKLARANDMCERVIGMLPNAMDAMKLCMLSTAIRRLRAKPPETRSDPQLKVVTVIEQCTEALSIDEKRAAVSQVHVPLAQDPNMELCARLAERCLRIPGCERSVLRICSIAHNLYAAGKLGIRRGEPPSAPPPSKGPSSAAAKSSGKSGGPPTTLPDKASKSFVIPDPSDEDWMWFALLLQYQALAILSLVEPSVQDKHTQLEIRKQALVALTNSAIAATRSPIDRRSDIILKDLRYYAAISAELASHPGGRSLALPSLKLILGDTVTAHIRSLSPPKRTSDGTKSDSSAPSQRDAEIVAKLFVMLVTAHRDRGSAEEGLAVMKAAFKILPAHYHKPFWDIDVHLRCQAGLPLNQTLLRVKEYDVFTQASVWMSLARYSPDRRNQLFAYQNAIELLAQGNPVDKAKHLLSLAQWMVASNYSTTLDDVRTVVLTAVDLCSSHLDLVKWSTAASAPGGGVRPHDEPATTHRSTSEASSVMSRKPPPATSASPSLDIRALVTMIEAYYLLSKLSWDAEFSTDGMPTDSRSCLALALHHVLLLWTAIVSSASQYRANQLQLQKTKEARAAALQSATQSVAASPPVPPKGSTTKSTPAINRGMSFSGAASNPSAAAATEEVDEEAEQAALSLPSTQIGWLTYRPSALLIRTMHDMVEAGDGTRASVLNVSNVSLPGVFLEVLKDLASALAAGGAPLAALPVLSLYATAAQLLMRNPSQVEALMHVAESDAYLICLQVGAERAAAAHRVANPLCNATVRAALIEDARMEAARLSSVSMDPSAAPGKDEAQHVDPNDGLRHRSSTSATTFFGDQQQFSSSLVQLYDASPHIYTHWIRIAEACLKIGRVSTAVSLVDEAAKLASRYRDRLAVAHCAYLNAWALDLQGLTDKALTIVRQAIRMVGDLTPGSGTVLQYRLLEVSLLASQGDIDGALSVEASLQAALDQVISSASGLQHTLASATVPRVRLSLALQLVRRILLVFAHRPDTNGVPPNGILKKLRLCISSRAEQQSPPPKDGVHVRESPDLLRLTPEAQLLLVEVERLLATSNHALGDRNAQLAREGQQLSAVVRSLDELSCVVHTVESPLDVLGDAARQPPQKLLGAACLALARNLIDTSLLKREIMAEYRRGTATIVSFPRVSEDGLKLEPKVVEFMRSSVRERNAAVRRATRAALRKQIEAQRAEARMHKQAQIELRREQRKIDDGGAAHSAKKETKAPSGKSSKTGASSSVAEEADVDPTDRCGIDSPPLSDDDGDGEDDVSEEESETLLAIRTAAGGGKEPTSDTGSASSDHARWVAHARLTHALTLASRAEELTGSVSQEGRRARLTQVRTLRLLSEDAALGLERRAALLKGEAANPDLPFLTECTAIMQRWRAPVEVDEIEHVVLPVKGAKGTGGSAKTAAAVDPRGAKGVQQSKALPSAPATIQPTAVDAPKRPHSPVTFPRPMLSAQALEMCNSIIVDAYRLDDVTLLRQALLELAHVAVCCDSPKSVIAGALAAVQACNMRQYLVDLWLLAAPRDSTEAVLYNNVRYLAADSSTAHTPVYAAAVKALYQNSRMASRLRIPESALALFLPADDVAECLGGTGAPPPAPLPMLPPDVIVLTIAADVLQNGTRQLFIVVHRGSKPQNPDFRRHSFSASVITQMSDAVQGIAAEKSSSVAANFHYHAQQPKVANDNRRQSRQPQATADVPEVPIGSLDVDFAQLCRNLNELLLLPLIGDLQPMLEGLAPKTHLILCIDPILQPLPFEATASLAKFKSISRDISYFSVCQRVARRGSEKFSSASVCFIVDPLAELPTNVSAIAGGDGERAKPAQWTIHTGSKDDSGNVQPLSTAAMLRSIAVPTSGQTTVVVASSGSLASLLHSIAGLVTPDLGHLRLFFGLTGVVTPAAIRRENQADMNKRPALHFAEQPQNAALLMLARGVDCVVANTLPVSVPTHEALIRLTWATLERSQMKNIAEVIRNALHRTLPSASNSEGKYELLKCSPIEKNDVDAFRAWSLPAMERVSYTVFGVSPEDGSSSASGVTSAKRAA